MIGRIGYLRGIGHQETSQRGEQELGTDLLLDAKDGLGAKLALGEVVALQQLVELFDLPAQVIELGELRQGDARSSQGGQKKPGLLAAGVDAYSAQFERRRAHTGRPGRWMHEHAVVLA